MASRDPLDQTEDLSSEPGSLVRLECAHLVVVQGAEAGRRATLESRLVIGTAAECDIALTDRAVSRTHAELLRTPSGVLLRDLGSKNGTTVNGNRVRELFLKAGDRITVGRTELAFEPRHEEVRIPPSTQPRFGAVYGASLAMRRVFGVLERVAGADATLLIHGETGTGKDLLAHAVHHASRRAKGPHIVFDCSAVSPELVAAELFGHTEGAFTGAKGRRQGAFEAASGGTIFLDEIGELPLDVQPKLLRALEAREVRPLGANTSVAVDVRVIAATHRDLAAMVARGKFREDLYYRLAVVRIELPALRQRLQDIPGLVDALLAGRAGRPGLTLTPRAQAGLARYHWPGNVRELRNVIERSAALLAGDRIDLEDLALDSNVVGDEREPVMEEPAPPAASAPPAAPASPAAPVSPAGRSTGTLEEIERDAILAALERAGGNQKEAARLLGIHRNTMRNRLRALGIKAQE